MVDLRRMAMFPLSSVLFPDAPLTLHVFEPRYRTMVEECLAGGREFGVVLISRGSEVGGGEQRFAVGTVARIVESARLADGRYALSTRGRQRVAVHEWLPDEPYPQAAVVDLGPGAPAPADLVERATAAVRRSRALLSELGQSPPLPTRPEGGVGAEPEVWGWRLCAQAPVSQLDRQRLLEAGDATDRLGLLTELADDVSLDVMRMLGEDRR